MIYKKYAEWIAEKIACQTMPYAQINNVDMNSCDIMIYGAGICGDQISGLNNVKRRLFSKTSGEIALYDRLPDAYSSNCWFL